MSEGKRKRRYTVEEREKYCAAFKESQLSAEAFCKEIGISKSTLYKWNQCDERDLTSKPTSNVGFSPVSLKEGSLLDEELVTTELQFSSGAILSLSLKESQLLSLLTRMVQ